ncbi:hypothetical protein PVAND_017129 [Polypedilum vanderplanki]|uniref:DRBM domain-containing protein n=1 Tax=Polypedilum vanderplanki TaxID=319348 RepID=A0A9J6BHF0_POLVA|nr:hypothetical protein PVAND_017129 [Polypedilum vanderplanki]
MNTKTPIMILRELCTKQKVPQPEFIEIDKEKLPENFSEPHLRFFMQVKALGKIAIGAGATKKSAEHSAAQKLLNLINCPDEVEENEEISINNVNVDYCSQLLDFCVQKNYHKPEIKEIESFGESHCPTFIFECKVDTICRRAQANNKKTAKQEAARNVLEIFRAMHPDDDKKVAEIKITKEDVNDEVNKKITTYMDLKKREKTNLMGVSISKRHEFFLNYKNEEIAKNLIEVLNENIEDKRKVEKLLETLKTEWDYEITDYKLSDDDQENRMKKFELFIDYKQFTVMLIEKEEELMNEILKYFTLMLTIPKNLDQKLDEKAVFGNIELNFVSI